MEVPWLSATHLNRVLNHWYKNAATSCTGLIFIGHLARLNCASYWNKKRHFKPTWRFCFKAQVSCRACVHYAPRTWFSVVFFNYFGMWCFGPLRHALPKPMPIKEVCCWGQNKRHTANLNPFSAVYCHKIEQAGRLIICRWFKLVLTLLKGFSPGQKRMEEGKEQNTKTSGYGCKPCNTNSCFAYTTEFIA